MTSPDLVVGAGIAAVGAAAYAVDTLVGRWKLTRPASLEVAETDDVAVARAVGVYVDTNGGRSSGQMAAAIASYTLAPVIPIRPAVDQGDVEHDICDACAATICRCHEHDQLHDVCVDTIARGCGHGRSLCVDCALGECDECLTDARSQGVLSQYGPFARFGGAS